MARQTNVYGLLDRLESVNISVRQDRCVMVRNRNARCLKCADACTSGCISFTGDELVVSPDKCIGCGTCATVCPTCALEAQGPNDAELLARCLGATEACEGVSCIACNRLLESRRFPHDARKVVGLPCLGRVEEALLAGLAARGATRLVLACGPCDSCPHAAGLQTAELVCSTANTLLEAWGSPVRARIVRGLPDCVRVEGDPDPSVEEGFYDAVGGLDALACPSGPEDVGLAGEGSLANEAPNGDDGRANDGPAKPRRTHVMADGTLPHFVPDRHERLLDALAELGEPELEAVLDTRLWGHVTIDVDACESCRMCAVFCPTGAIAKFGEPEGEGPFGIDHFPGDCVKCRCCENICPARALKVLDGVHACDLLDGTVEHVEMHPVRVQKGGARSIMNSMRALLGMEEIYER